MTTARATETTLTSADAPKRAVIYTRISKDSAKLGLGVERQVKVCRALAARYNWDVVTVMVENDTSSLKGLKVRPRYRELLAMIESAEVDVVVSWAQDRLLRKPLELEGLIILAETHPFTIAHEVDMWTDLSTASGRELARYHVARSKGEMERKSERQKGAYLQSAEMGKPPNGRAFGYERDGTIIPEEAEVVRDLFARYVAGEGVSGLVNWLNAQGIPNTKGRPWGRYGLIWLLRNPRYIGERHRVVNKDGRNRWEYVGPGKWEAVIGRDTFKAAEAKAKGSAEHHNRTAPNKKWLGAGLYVCGVCGRKLLTHYQQWTTVDGVHHPGRRYTCMPTRHLVRKAEEIDEMVERYVSEYLSANDLAALMEDDREVAESRRLREQAQELESALTELGAALARRELSPMLAGQAERRINEELASIDVQLAKSGQRSALALVAGASDPGLAWKELTGRDIGAAQSVVDSVAVITLLPGKRGRGAFNPDTVKVEWRVKGQ